MFLFECFVFNSFGLLNFYIENNIYYALLLQIFKYDLLIFYIGGILMDIIWFKDISKKDIGTVGGKGANLGEMYNAGLPIPPGFCISAQAYEKFLDEAEIKDIILDMLSDLDEEDTQKLQNISEEIHSVMLSAKFPSDLKKEILNAYKKVEGFVAVRSSATAEDLPTASFAGQQATFLNVKGEENLIDAVKKCWASLFTARAIYYREKNKFKHKDVLISVVVQKMVNSDTAGVAFTANPVTNDLKEMIIEGSFGLGEMVVSGSVSPDSYIVLKDPLSIKDVYIAEKKKMMFRGENGENVFKDLSSEKANDRVLNEEQILELAKMCLKIEEHYGKPQDIEWAFEKGKLFITQSRPITTLK